MAFPAAVADLDPGCLIEHHVHLALARSGRWLIVPHRAFLRRSAVYPAR
jgi:hypothetical protein